MTYVLRHKTTGYFLSGLASLGMFAHSPNAIDAVAFPDFPTAEKERRAFHEFAGAWMAVPSPLEATRGRA